MAIIWNAEIQIALGHDNEAGFATIESVLNPTITVFGAPEFFTFYQPGELRQKANGTFYARGYPSTQWVISLMTFQQHYTLVSSYTSGEYAGEVTIRTTTDNPDAYVNRNATLQLPTPAELEPLRRAGSNLLENYAMRFVRMGNT